MVFDSLNNLMRYAPLHPNFAAAFAQTLRLLREGGLKPGKNVLSDSAYINLSEYTTRPAEGAEFEAHRDYIDVQILLSGAEKFDCAPLAAVAAKPTVPYCAEQDYALYGGEAAVCCTLLPEHFVICFPEDAHKPTLILGEAAVCKKAILKVRV